MKKKLSQKVTIKHIAEIAGYSFSTVAKALREDPVIKDETKKHIQQVAKELNYFPNIHASGLRSRKSKTIGIILNDLKNPFYSEIYKAIEDVVNKKDYTMILCDSDFTEKLEEKNLISMISRGVDGIIMSPINESSQNLNLILEHNIHNVILDCKPTNSSFSYVYVNHEQAASTAVTYLFEKGHKNILLLNGPEKLSSSNHFLEGYLSTSKNNDAKIQNRLILHLDISIESSFNFFKDLFTGKAELKHTDFTAIVSLSDLLALGVYKAAKEFGFKIPDDYSVIGYDNILATEYVNPPLTTIHQPKFETGSQSIEMLFNQINGIENAVKNIILEPILIERDSVKTIEKNGLMDKIGG